MQYDLIIEKGKDKPIISYLRKFDFVTVKKRKSVKREKIKTSIFSYFGMLPDLDFDVSNYRKKSYRKTKLDW
jgi:hypothetical protein